MKTCSIVMLFTLMTLTGCAIESDDGGDDDGGSMSDDDGDDGGDSNDGDGGDSNDGDGGDSNDGDGGDSDGDGGDSDGDGGDSVQPRTGVWRYAEYDENRNDCDLPPDYGNGNGGFGIDDLGGDRFVVIPNDGTDPFDCTLDGADFDCPDRATEVVPAGPPYDAVLLGQARVEGTFSDPENGSGTQTAIIQCNGADCPLVELGTGVNFPCTFAIDFVIEWRAVSRARRGGR